jgi:hypothetical protein
MVMTVSSQCSFLYFQGIFQGPGQYLAYTAVNSAGKLGCKCTLHFSSIDSFLFPPLPHQSFMWVCNFKLVLFCLFLILTF